MTVTSLAKAVVGSFSPRAAAKLSIWNRARIARRSGEPELRLAPLLCVSDRLMLDVGANVGLYSYTCLPHSFGVVAFEPHPVMAKMLRNWGGGRLKVLDMAASDGDGVVTLTVPIRGQSDNEAMASLESTPLLAQLAQQGMVHELKVRKATIDSLGLPPIGFMKIDVEGHEAEVVAGALQTISRDRPNILVEAEERHRPGSLQKIRDALEPIGYKGFFVSGNNLRRIEEFVPGVHQSADFGLGPKPQGIEYINNFIFLAGDSVQEKLVRAL